MSYSSKTALEGEWWHTLKLNSPQQPQYSIKAQKALKWLMWSGHFSVHHLNFCRHSPFDQFLLAVKTQFLEWKSTINVVLSPLLMIPLHSVFWRRQLTHKHFLQLMICSCIVSDLFPMAAHVEWGIPAASNYGFVIVWSLLNVGLEETRIQNWKWDILGNWL